MAARKGACGVHHSTRQKGTNNRRSGVGTYSREKKSQRADRYDRPAIARGNAK